MAGARGILGASMATGPGHAVQDGSLGHVLATGPGHAIRDGVLGHAMATGPGRATQDGVLGHVMASGPGRAFQDGSLGMATGPGHAYRDGSLGCGPCQSSMGATLTASQMRPPTTRYQMTRPLSAMFANLKRKLTGQAGLGQSGVALSTDMMIGIVLGAGALMFYIKNQQKKKGA